MDPDIRLGRLLGKDTRGVSSMDPEFRVLPLPRIVRLHLFVGYAATCVSLKLLCRLSSPLDRAIHRFVKLQTKNCTTVTQKPGWIIVGTMFTDMAPSKIGRFWFAAAALYLPIASRKAGSGLPLKILFRSIPASIMKSSAPKSVLKCQTLLQSLQCLRAL
jgi:hypothetical protein